MLRDILKGSTLVFISNLFVNASAFVVLNIASTFFTVEEFAKLSFIFSISALISVFLDLGFSNSVIPFYRKYRDESVLMFSILFRYAIFTILLIVVGFASWFDIFLDYAFALLLASALNIWQGRKLLYLAQKMHKNYLHNALAYVFLRTAFALFALYLYGTVGIFSIFYWVLPAIFIEVLRYKETLKGSVNFSVKGMDFRELLNYSFATYLSAIFFSTFVQVSIIYSNYYLDSSAVANIGVANIFLAMFALFAASLRNVLLPYVSEGYFKSSIDVIKANKYKIFFVLIASLATIWGIHYCIYLFYSNKYADAHIIFLILGIGQFFTIIFGLYNTRIHELRMPMLEAKVNGIRVFLAILFVLLFKPNLLELVGIISFISVLFELLLSIYLSKR